MDNVITIAGVDKAKFTFHCLDGDVYTTNKMVSHMFRVQKGNSFNVSFDKTVVSAAIKLLTGAPDINMEGTIVKKFIKELVEFYQCVGLDFNYKERYWSVAVRLNELIYENVSSFISIDLLGSPMHPKEYEDFYEYYILHHINKECLGLSDYKHMLEFLDIENHPSLIDDIKEVRKGGDFSAYLFMNYHGKAPPY